MGVGPQDATSTEGGSQPKQASDAGPSDLAKQELREAIETFRVQYSLTVQVLAALLAADVAAVGFAFNQQSSGLLLASSLLPAMVLASLRAIGRRMVPILYTAIVLEGLDERLARDGLATAYITVVLSPRYLAALRNAVSMEEEARSDYLRRLPSPILRTSYPWMLLIVVGGTQLCASMLTLGLKEWSFP